MFQISDTVITAIIAPVVLFGLQAIRDWRREKRDGTKEVMKDLRMVTLRLELLFNLAHNANDIETILKLYDKYHASGGNSYITQRVKEAMKAHENKRMKK